MSRTRFVRGYRGRILHPSFGESSQVSFRIRDIIPHLEWIARHKAGVPCPLDKQLATFLRRARGEQTFAEFSRKTGLPPSTLHRLENGEQSATLTRVHQLLTRLKCSPQDVFPK